MSAGRRRLEDALLAGKDISEKGQELESQNENGVPQNYQVSSVKDIDFGDIMGVYSINLSYNAQYIAAGCGNGSIQVYSCDTGKKRRPLKHGSLYGLPVTAVKFFPYKDNRLITAGSDGTITVWDMEEWHNMCSVDEPHNEISTLDFSHDGKLFATAGKDKNIRIYDTMTFQMTQEFGSANSLEAQSDHFLTPESGHGRKVFAVRFHPFDDNVFLTGGWDRCVKIWDVRVDQVVRTINGPYICGDGIDFDEDLVLTASWVAHDALQVWDYGSGELIEEVPFPAKEHGQFLYVGRFCSSDIIAAGGSGTNDLKIINRKTKEVLDALEDENKPVQALDVSIRNNMFAFGTTGNHLKLAAFSS